MYQLEGLVFICRENRRRSGILLFLESPRLCLLSGMAGNKSGKSERVPELSVANVRASEPNVRALRATEKHRHDRLCSLSFRSLASPLSRREKYEIQTMEVMS